jgi:hypothetical protein
VVGIGVDEVAPEASAGSVEVAGLDRQVQERVAIAVGRQVPPRRTEDAEMVEPVLARRVQRERGRERSAEV